MSHKMPRHCLLDELMASKQAGHIRYSLQFYTEHKAHPWKLPDDANSLCTAGFPVSECQHRDHRGPSGNCHTHPLSHDDRSTVSSALEQSFPASAHRSAVVDPVRARRAERAPDAVLDAARRRAAIRGLAVRVRGRGPRPTRVGGVAGAAPDETARAPLALFERAGAHAGVARDDGPDGRVRGDWGLPNGEGGGDECGGEADELHDEDGGAASVGAVWSWRVRADPAVAVRRAMSRWFAEDIQGKKVSLYMCLLSPG